MKGEAKQVKKNRGVKRFWHRYGHQWWRKRPARR